MTIQEALKQCGWNDVLIEHFTKDSFEPVDEGISFVENVSHIDNANIFITANTKNDKTGFIFAEK